MFLKSLVILTSLIQAFSWSDVKDAVGRFLVEPVCKENNEQPTTEGCFLLSEERKGKSCYVWLEKGSSATIVYWMGDCKEGLAAGEGKVFFSNSKHEELGRYEGEMLQGKKHGNGTLTKQDRTERIGRWDSDIFVEGSLAAPCEGTYDAHRSLQVGKFNEFGQLMNPGEISYCDGYHFKGERKDNGLTTIGTWDEEKLTGKGILTHRCLNKNSARTYTADGNWVSGKLNGYAEVQYCNGSIYKGEWKEGRENGFGEKTWYSGNKKYSGEWVNGERTGKGVYTDSCGVNSSIKQYKMDGNWISGKLNGYAEAYWCTGDSYKGEWQDDKYHGTGTYHSLGSIYSFIGSFTGQFTNGVFPDKGVIIYDDGNRYTGSLNSKGQRNGSGVMTYSNGQVKDGEWHYDTFEEPYQEPPSPPPPPAPVYEPPPRTYECTCSYQFGFAIFEFSTQYFTWIITASDYQAAMSRALYLNEDKYGKKDNGCIRCVRVD